MNLHLESDDMPEKLERSSLKDQAEKKVREMIQSYRFAPGKWINIEQLAKDLGVSRTPIFQALKVLEAEGLVTHVPNRGIQMASMTMDMAHELYLVRGMLEGMAGRLVAENINAKSIRRLEKILKKQKAIVSQRDVLAYSTSDFEFHSVIYDHCGNWLLKELLENIKSRSRPFVCDIAPILPDLYQDHLRLLECFKDHDPKCAEQAMLSHNERMKNLINQAREEKNKYPENC